jgi:Fe-S-cluster containining protein
MDDMKKEFPEGMEPLGKSVFRFACHPGVQCYMSCCRKLDLILYPYDIIRLKNRLQISSEELLRNHTRLGPSTHPYFPAVMLLMSDNEEQTCPFLNERGCSVYEDRPTACRTYPLERAVDRNPGHKGPSEFYFMTSHPYCLGHNEETEWTVKNWLRDQQVHEFNAINDLWAEVDTLFSHNPWQGEGVAGSRQQMAFMVCYNIDGFRSYIKQTGLLEQFKLNRTRIQLISNDDETLLKFGFEWLKHVLAGSGPLKRRR